MPLRSCLVSLTATSGVRHSVEVVAESLFEAAVMGMQILKADQWLDQGVAGGARIEVEVREPVTKHTVTLTQIQQWLNGATISPNERVKKERLRGMLKAQSLGPASSKM